MSKNHLFLMPLSFLFLQLGTAQNTVELIPTFNEGGYTLKVNESKKSEKVYIYGRVYDIATKKPLDISQVIYGCAKLKTKEGAYFFEQSLNPNQPIDKDLNFFEAQALGYYPVETERFDLSNVDTLHIDFYLMEDLRPLIQCE